MPSPSKPAFSHIVVGVDFSKASRAALQQAAVLAGSLGARLDILYIAPRARPALPFSKQNREASKRIQKEEVEVALGKLARWKPKAPGLDVRIRVQTGVPSTGLVAYVRKVGADLVVVANGGHGAVHDLLLGSTADHVLRMAPVPVLLVPSAGSARRGER